MDETIYLAHHGILGQKWGKKNGPPYPLNETQKSNAEKKKRKSIVEKLQDDELDKHDLFEFSSGLAYSISSVGVLLSALTGNLLIATGANYVSSVMVAAGTAMITPEAMKTGREFINLLKKG